MDPGHPFETLQGSGDRDGIGVSSWVSVCPRGLWKVQQKQICKGNQQTVSNSGDNASSSCCPRLGSLCRVRVQLKANLEDSGSLVSEEENEKLSVSPESVTEIPEATAFQRCQDSVLQVPLGDWTTLRLGDGQCDITEACVERMRAGEKCEILITPVGNGPDDSVPHTAEDNLPLRAIVELDAFTPGKESWEMFPGEKWQWVKSYKERGGMRFRSGDVWGAAVSYSRALKLLITLHIYVRKMEERGQEAEEQRVTNTGDNMQQHLPSAAEFKIYKAELHSNMSLCQLKLNQPERAKDSATKAVQLEPGSAKAWYRKGQACQMLNELEEAKQAFRKLLELQPESPAALKALKDIASREKERNTQLGLRLSKMFS